MKTIINQNNTAITQRLVKEINALPKLEYSCVHNPDFNEPIVELTENQLKNYKYEISKLQQLDAKHG